MARTKKADRLAEERVAKGLVKSEKSGNYIRHPSMSNNGKKSPIIGDTGVRTEPGDNSRYARISRDLISFPPIDIKDVSALQARFQEYIQYCIDNDVKPGNMACYSALGVTKQQAYEWEHGFSGTKEQAYFIKKVKFFCTNCRELLMQDGKINPVTGIFWQKNYDGLKDVQDVVIAPKQDTPDFDVDEIKKRYLEQNYPIDSVVSDSSDKT